MTVSTVAAHCPRCGNVDAVFIRSDDGSDLVCRSPACIESRRERRPMVPPTEQATRSRRIFGRR